MKFMAKTRLFACKNEDSTDKLEKRRLHCMMTKPGRDVLRALIITAIAMLISWLFFPPHFTETNDDMIMACFSYGYMGDYSARLVFINSLVGYLLKGCMMLMPQVPWYALFQCILVYVSFTVLVYLMLRKFEGCRAIVPIGLLFVFFGYQFFSSLQFTKTAAAASAAGLLLMFYAVTESRKWYTYVLAGVLTLAGSLYRFRIFEMLLIFGFGIGFLLVWKQLIQKQWREMVRICVPFVLVLALCFGCYALDRWSYNHTDGWENFWEYNYLRDNLQNSRQLESDSTGFPNYDENQELYESLGITRNDYNLYRSSNFADTELFTQEVLEQLVAAKGTKPINLYFLKSFVRDLCLGLLDYSFFPVLLIAFLAGVLGLCKKRNDRTFLVVYEALAFLGVQLYFFYRGRYLQSRTDISVILAVVMILILYVWDADTWLPTKRKTAVFLTGSLLLTTLSYHYERYQTDASALQASQSTEVHELISSDKEHFYLCFSNWRDFPDKMYDIWHVSPKGCGSNRSSLGTWRVSTYTVQNKMEQYGITNPYRDMVCNPDVFLLCVNNTNLEQVLTHIWEHYNADVGAYMVKLVESTYPIYRITDSDPTLDVTDAIDGTDLLHSNLTYEVSDGYLVLDGFLYGDNMNSFASNIYIGIVDPDGEESFYFGTQYKSAEFSDNMNGEYGAFTRTLQMPEEGSSINLYLELDDTIYMVPMGEFPAER